MNPICIYDPLLKHNKTTHFLKERLQNDEKWIVYNNMKRQNITGEKKLS